MMDLCLRLPWINRKRPYVALHIKHWGWALGRGRHRQIFVVLLMCGRQFSNSNGWMKSWRPEIPWRRSTPQSHISQPKE